MDLVSLPVEILDVGVVWILNFFGHSSAGKRITQMQFQIDKMKEEIFNLEQGNIFIISTIVINITLMMMRMIFWYS